MTIQADKLQTKMSILQEPSEDPRSQQRRQNTNALKSHLVTAAEEGNPLVALLKAHNGM